MSDLRELYQQMIIDHAKKPRNFKLLENSTHTAEGYNPLCGDKITIYARIEGGVVVDVTFKGSGCAISTASSSLMTEAAKNKSIKELESMIHSFQQLVTADPTSRPDASRLGKLAVFAGVCEYPTRVKCATLPWHTLHNAMCGKDEVTSTE